MPSAERFSSLPKIEGVQPDILVALSWVQGVQIGDPIRTQHYGLAVDDE
jgi:hypothetical protein